MDANSALDHAWRYFQLHAQQRISVFNFYVVFAGLLITGIATASRDFSDNVILIGSLGILLTGLSFLFYKLDERVSFLIKRAEVTIRENEPINANLFENDTIKNQWTYGRSFRIAFSAMFGIGLFILFLSFYEIFFKNFFEQ